ncbi:MAG: fimbrillin family protein [Bacteroidales bacterium]|nr:fimbrillin family protein [Bacteroidales bacterium]
MSKKIFFAIPAVLVLASCANDEIDGSAEQSGRTPISVTTYVPGQTRSIATLSTLQETGFQLKAQYENDGNDIVIFNKLYKADTNGTCTSDDGELDYWPSTDGATVEFLGIYPEHYVGSNITAEKNDDEQMEVTLSTDGSTDYIVAYTASQKTADGSISLTFKHMLAQVTLNVNCDDAPMTYQLTKASLLAPSRATYNCTTKAITPIAGNENISSRALLTANDNPVRIETTSANIGELMVCASNDATTGTTCTLSLTYLATYNDNVQEYTRTADVKIVAGYTNVINATISGNRPLTIAANMTGFQKIALANGHEYVDLGLPSGLLWATMNIGAESPEGYGDYFAWGETEPHYSIVDNDTIWKNGYSDGYVWGTYKYGTETNLTKYIDTEETLLLDDDDAATANWGGNWRMPTIDEWNELLNEENCTNIWTNQNGVNGRLFTSNQNGNTLFIPTNGDRVLTELHNAGVGCNYWSSSRNTTTPSKAWYQYLGSSLTSIYDYDRFNGLSIRAVIEPKPVEVP